MLEGAPADLVVVFAAGAHLAAPEATLEGVHAELAPEMLIGCGAGGVLGDGPRARVRHRRRGVGRALGEGAAPAVSRAVTEVPEGGLLEGLPEPEADAALIMLSDPYSFPTDAVLAGLGRDAPGIPVLGGLSSARTLGGTARSVPRRRRCTRRARSASVWTAWRCCRAFRRAPPRSVAR